MSRMVRGILSAALGCALTTSAVRAEVLNVTGSAQSSILQFFGPLPIQTDFAREAVPQTQASPPIAARSSLDRLNSDGTTSASAQAISLLDKPVFSGGQTPNDAGLDLSAFSDDDVTGWRIEGIVNETRRVRVTAADIGGIGEGGPPSRVRSRVLLTGVMLIASLRAGTDLTGVEVNLTFSVSQRRADQRAVTLISGDVALAGGPNGTVSIVRQAGALANVNFPIVDFTNPDTNVSLAKAILFTGLSLPYEYDIALNEEFDLDLAVQSQVITKPGGVGASSTFGVPQDAIGVVFERVKSDSRGRALANAVSQQVDTTGASYLNGSSPFPALPFCGLLGIESAGLAALAMMVPFVRSYRMRRMRRSRV